MRWGETAWKKEEQLYTHTIGHGVGWDVRQKKWRVTHLLLPIDLWSECSTKRCSVFTHWLFMGWDMMGQVGTKRVQSLTRCRPWDKMWWDFLTEQYSVTHLLTVGMRCDVTATKQTRLLPLTRWLLVMGCMLNCCGERMGSITYSLLAWCGMWWESKAQKWHCHLLAVGHGVRYDETTIQNKYTVTHKLPLPMGYDVIRLIG